MLPSHRLLALPCATDDGRKVLLHLAPGTKEDTARCTSSQDLKRRGLPDPLLAISDGAAGLIRAVETCFPRALRQRCLVHRLRNLRAPVVRNKTLLAPQAGVASDSVLGAGTCAFSGHRWAVTP